MGPDSASHSPTPRNAALMAQTGASKDFQILSRVQEVTEKFVCEMVAERKEHVSCVEALALTW